MANSAEPSAFRAAADTVAELRYVFEQCRATYHDPNAFMVNAGQFIQAGRNLTFRLQSWKNDVRGFDEWYQPWREQLQSHVFTGWLKEARNDVVKRRGLEASSTARVVVRVSYIHVDDRTFELPPFIKTKDMIRDVTDQLEQVDSSHATIQIERRWVTEELPDEELLDVFAECLRVYECMVQDFIFHCGTKGQPTDPATLVVKYAPLFDKIDLMRSRTIYFVPSASEERGLPVFRVADTRDAEAWGQQAAHRYGQPDLVGFDSADPFDYAVSFVMPIAQRILERDGYHCTMVHALDMSGRWNFFDVTAWDRPEKYLMWNLLADRLREIQCRALVIVADSWVYDKEAMDRILESGVFPNDEDVRGKSEALVFHAVTNDEQYCVWERSYHRESEKIVWDTELTKMDIGLDAVGLLKPVLAVWREQAGT